MGRVRAFVSQPVPAGIFLGYIFLHAGSETGGTWGVVDVLVGAAFMFAPRVLDKRSEAS